MKVTTWSRVWRDGGPEGPIEIVRLFVWGAELPQACVCERSLRVSDLGEGDRPIEIECDRGHKWRRLMYEAPVVTPIGNMHDLLRRVD